MEELVINILRGGVTAVMNVLMMFTLAQPKYGKKSAYCTAIAVFLFDMGTSIWYYRSGNLTDLAQFDIMLLPVIGVLLKPLMRDSFMQWCFSFMTAINFYAIVVVLSYHLCDYLPYPPYANSFLRLVIYLAFIILFRRYLRPYYRRVAENWAAFLILAVLIFINFAYYFIFTDDVVQTLNDAMWPMLLLIALTLALYGTVFFFLKKISDEYAIREENLRMKNDSQLLQLSANSMAERLNLMDEVAQQNSRAAHDRRHFNNMVLELLEQGDKQNAIILLRKQSQTLPKMSRVYCENPAVNAAVSHYANIAEQAGIETSIELDIPNELSVDSLQLSMVVSNLLENAIQAREVLADGTTPYLHFTCLNVGRLLLEVENSCGIEVSLDENGHPVTDKEGHGIGSKSVTAFAKKYDGELIYSVDNGVFRVRLLV